MAESIDIQQLRANADAAGQLLKALANPDRLLLLCQLSQGERNVSELEALLGIQQPTLSQQLAVLRREGLVDTRRDGKQIFYRGRRTSCFRSSAPGVESGIANCVGIVEEPRQDRLFPRLSRTLRGIPQLSCCAWGTTPGCFAQLFSRPNMIGIETTQSFSLRREHTWGALWVSA